MTASAGRGIALLASGLMCALMAGSAAGQAPSRPDSISLIVRGARVFARECQRCHNARSPAERTDREWIIIIQHMQIRANLSADRAEAVRAFLLASNRAGPSPGRVRTGEAEIPTGEAVTETMIRQGSEIYHGAGGCVACHGANLQGGPIAPSLADGRWKHGEGTLADILSVIRKGVPGTAMVAYPAGISDEDAVRVAAYVWSVAHGKTAP